MRAARKTAAATKTSEQCSYAADRSKAGGVIDPGMFEIENPATEDLDLWTEMNHSFNASYQLSRIHSEHMQFADDQKQMTELTEQLRFLVRGTKLAQC